MAGGISVNYEEYLAPFQLLMPISVFYPHFRVLSLFQRLIRISSFYPHFSFWFQFRFRHIHLVSAFYSDPFITCSFLLATLTNILNTSGFVAVHQSVDSGSNRK